MISEIPSLTNLKSLKNLQANNNFINKLGSFKGINNLEEIYLSNNKLTSVIYFKNLKSLKTLDLHNNLINDLLPLKNIIKDIGIEDSKWIVGTVNIKDNNIDEAFVNILRMPASQDRRKEIDNYFKRIEQGNYKEVKKLKLVLLGNTGAGKTTLADILAKEKKAFNGSTHGVNFFNFNVEDINVRGYDFGGQDYYHNTHYSFFDNGALYAIIWGNNQKDKFNQSDEEILFPLNYWLGSLNKYSYSEIIHNFYEQLNIFKQQNDFNHLQELNNILSDYDFPILNEDLSIHIIDSFITNTNVSLNKIKRNINEIVHKIDKVLENDNFIKYRIDNNFSSLTSYIFQNINDFKIWLNELDYKSQYGFIIDFLSYNFNRSSQNVKLKFEKIVRQHYRISKLPLIDFDLGLILENNKDKILLHKEDVKSLKSEINDYDNDELDSILQSLHSTLSCYYFKIEKNVKEKFKNNVLEDIVILDIEKFTDWIYKIFEQKRTNTFIQQEIEEDNTSKEDIFLKIRSKDKKGYFNKKDAIKWINDEIAINYIDYILAFMLQNKMIFKMKDRDCFFAPNYLPEEQTQTENFFLSSFDTPIIKYVFNGHFHTSVISEIIDKYIDNLILENNKMRYVLWKNKVLLYEDESNKSKLVYLHLDILCKTNPTISINKFDDSVSDSFILELCDFIEKIIKNYDYNKMIKTKNGSYIPFDKLEETNFGQDNKPVNLFSYENVIYRRSDFKIFLKNEKNYPMKKIFISYSKDDLTLVNQFQDHLAPLKRDGLIATWFCTELIAGGEWDKDIQHHFNESDIICFMVSPNLMKTDYVFNHEIKKAIDRQKNDAEFKIVPIILNYCSWTTNDYNLGNYTALPYTAKPVSDFKDKDMAWYIVTECIKVLISSKKQPSTDNWYNLNLPKDIRKIYERIVEGKVDNNS
jgi:GTPase SAR1 family protein